MKTMTIEEARTYVMAQDIPMYKVLAIRFDDEDNISGDRFIRNSSVWSDGDWSDEELDGVCSLKLNDCLCDASEEYFDFVFAGRTYYSGNAYLISGKIGDICDNGRDIDTNEVVVEDAQIIAQIIR